MDRRKKLPFGVTDDFLASLKTNSSLELKLEMLKLQKEIVDVDHAIDHDPSIVRVRAEWRLTAGPYFDNRRRFRNCLRRLVRELDERNANGTNESFDHLYDYTDEEFLNQPETVFCPH